MKLAELATATTAHDSGGDRLRFSLSPQRGEGRGEGWEPAMASKPKEITGRITPHPQSLSPLRGEGSRNASLLVKFDRR